MTEGAQETRVARRQRAPITEAPAAAVPALLSEFDRMMAAAQAYAKADILPELYSNKPSNILIAMEIASRVGQHWLAVAQNLYVANKRPGWMTSYLIGLASVNHAFASAITWTDNGKHEKREGGAGDAKGRYPLDLVVSAHVTLLDGTKVDEPVSMEEAIADGWIRNAKYRTIPHLMLRYRSASRLIKLYAPQVAHGMMTVEELDDMPEVREVKVVDVTTLASAPVAPMKELVRELVAAEGTGGAAQEPQDAPAPSGDAEAGAEPQAPQEAAPAQPTTLPKPTPPALEPGRTIEPARLDELLDRLDEVAQLKKVGAMDLLTGIVKRRFNCEPLEVAMTKTGQLSKEVDAFIARVKSAAEATT